MAMDPSKFRFKKKSRLSKSMQEYVRWQVCEDYLELATPTTVAEAIEAVTIQMINTTPWIVSYEERLEEVKMAFENIPPDTLVWELFAGEEEPEEEIREIFVEVAPKPIKHGFKSPPPAFSLPKAGTPPEIIEAADTILSVEKEITDGQRPVTVYSSTIPGGSIAIPNTKRCTCKPTILFGKETHQAHCATRK